MEFVVVFVGLKLGNLLLPICIKDVAVRACEALVDLETYQRMLPPRGEKAYIVHLPMIL